ncbi:hypothetical protein PA598K_01345 [Paenibacillus sp. 598K]|uniref:hypothetical protein n=1 Tax=Paenibacillus sp. 598K TaxID=1117987 RepID=UPI000FF94288|nr:hypothetical protein [Paenibacillus sp. 598K]GBF73060.1 hypothetical protein PA598K_01345 [Paenibacillus sp. 598K]
MQYEVTKVFRDKNTGKRYPVGSVYTGEDAERIEELQEKGYLADEPVESKAPEDPAEELKQVGKGVYELPNGEKVKGKEAALEALAKLNAESSE